MRRSAWFITLVGLGIAMASGPVAAQAGQLPDGDPVLSAACDIAGSWVGSSPAIPGFYSIPLVVTQSVAPTDASRHRFTAVVLPVNGDATLGGLFPDADQTPAGVTTYVRSGPQTFTFTTGAHFVKSPPAGSFERGQILYFWTWTGTVDCLDANTMALGGTISFYSNVDRPDLVVPPLGIFGVHDQDLDDDGLADEGEVPFFMSVFGITYKRLR